PGSEEPVRYSIEQKYRNYGGPRGILGLPITGEMVARDSEGGRYRHFRGLVFGASGNMISVRVPDRAGRPSCAHPEKGDVTRLESSIYWTRSTGAHVIQGEIRDLWLKLGAQKSKLGYPIEDETDTPDGRGRMSRFQRGEIWWYPDKGAFVR